MQYGQGTVDKRVFTRRNIFDIDKDDYFFSRRKPNEGESPGEPTAVFSEATHQHTDERRTSMRGISHCDESSDGNLIQSKVEEHVAGQTANSDGHLVYTKERDGRV